LGAGAAARIRLADVSGDLILDVVAPSPLAQGATLSSGLIYMWLGGGTLTGAKAQDATLGVTAPALGDALAAGAAGRVLVGDVNNDAIADVIGRRRDAGGIYVWYGGAGLVGASPEDALLTVPSPTAGDRLGSGGTRLADLTGDGILDIVSSAPLTDVGGVFDVGAVHVWAGGVALAGPLSPFASLRVAGSIDDRLSYEAKEITFASRFGDVTGDSALDIVVPAFRADIAGTADVGAVYVWRGGGTMTGTPAPAATLLGPGSVFGDMVGLSSGANVALADVSGDGRFDVVAAASAADIGSALNAGAIYMWRGGATLTGTLTPTATMRDASPNSNDLLAGGLTEGVAWDLADVNADSVRDVIAIAPQSDTVAGANAGAGFYWAGGAALVGNRTQTAEFLAPAASSGDLLGASGGTVDLLFPVDVTDDGLADVLIGASSYTGSGPSERGGLFLWQGGGGLTGTPSTTANLLAPTPVALDRLGN
ncbi:MAG TPA: hypothetical protein VND21_02685, partial [Planctomycetota bacterium]|nr:hypothetical protein [Planctomycetota bacterium]